MGGMPERLVLPDDAMAVRYFQNLVEDVMTRDVLLRYDVPHPVALQRLVQMLMGSMSCPMTVNKLKQRLAGERYSLSPLVITEYLGMLGDCYMVFLVPIRSANMAVRSVNPKKVYVGDHALAAAFAQSVSPNQDLRWRTWSSWRCDVSRRISSTTVRQKERRLISPWGLIHGSDCFKSAGTWGRKERPGIGRSPRCGMAWKSWG
jgi:hypothetical protein